MAKGIVAKIWNIKEGSMGRGAGAQISDSISYITNSEKCDETLTADSLAQIGRELKYVTNDVKTLEGLYVGCRNISDLKNATNEMLQIKEFFKKFGGRVALHGIISLDERESDKKNAGKLMMLLNDLLEEVFPNYQAVYAVHTNTENLHIHFILNTVGLNGRKIHMDSAFMSKVFEPALNRLAKKYGFTPNELWEKEKKIEDVSFGEIMAKLRNAVDEAIERSESFDELISDLKAQGIKVNFGKHLSLKTDGMTRAIRSNRLGSMYTVEMIRDRIISKREELIRSEVGDYVEQKKDGAYVFVDTKPLKKFSEMTPKEKKEAIRLLRLGKNPWRERYESNWQMQRMADEFRRTANVYELIRLYAPKGNAQDALDNILKRQKELASEKKQVRENLKTHQPMIRLYKEAKKHAKKAYLYEFAGCEEYLSEYVSYKKLCKRLEDGYGKDITEVASFVDDQEAAILYATAQSRELSDEYKTILRFKENELKQGISEYVSLYDAIGYSKARSQAIQYGVFETSIKYIAADGVDGAYLRVVITPDVVDGKRTEKAVVTVFDAKGNATDEITSEGVSVRDFNKSISELKGSTGFYKCHVFDEKDKATEYVESQKTKKSKKISHSVTD